MSIFTAKKSLHACLRELCEIDGSEWIRLLYCYPEEIYPELLQTMAREPKICHYLDLPIQHAHDAILKRMGREPAMTTWSHYQKLREADPGYRAPDHSDHRAFPGETEEQHEGP